MSKSVVICNIMYYKPGNKEKSSNYRHVRYIALKPEADRGDEDSMRVGDEGYQVELETPEGHVKYAAERPGSSGLFGPEEEPIPDWKQVADALAQHELPVWRLVISLREDDAVRLGFVDRANWKKAVRQGVQDAIKAMHLDLGHVCWTAAYHQKKGHPHVHLVIWEDSHEAVRREGRLEPGEVKNVWRSFARELYREERDKLNAEKTAIRDAVRDLAKENVALAVGVVKEIRTSARLEAQVLEGGAPGVPPVLREDKEAELVRRLEELAVMMPGRGRVALAYMPEEVKAKARDLADWLLRQPYFMQSAERYGEIARQMALHYTRKPEAVNEAGRKAYADLRDRVTQVMLRAAAGINRPKRQACLDQELAARTAWRGAWRAVERERLRAEAKAQLASMREVEQAEERGRREREGEIGCLGRL